LPITFRESAKLLVFKVRKFCLSADSNIEWLEWPTLMNGIRLSSSNVD